MQRKPSAKVHAEERLRKSLNPVRIQQHTALLLMRQLQACTNEPDAPVAIDYMDLAEREFVDLTAEQQRQLPKAIEVLRLLLQDTVASAALMRAALSDAQHAEYENSFDSAVTHIEDMWESRPEELDEYLRLVKLGDLLTGASERISRRARTSVRGVQYTAQGHTTASSVWYKAEQHYESALMYLQGECENSVNAARLQPWFDRELDFTANTGTLSADAVGVPRLCGSRSQYCKDKTRNLWGARKGKFYRQREAVTEAVYAMLFADDEVENSVVSAKLQQLLQQSADEYELRNLFD